MNNKKLKIKFSVRKHFSIIIFSLLSFNVSAKEQANTTIEFLKKNTQKHALQLLKDPVFRSLSIGIYKDGKAYTGYFGELEKGKKANDKTFFEIASVTKSFTGTLVAQAVLDGKFSVDDDIRKYLEKDYPNLAFKDKPIKIRHLITHTSGLPANHKDFEAVPFNNDDGLLWNRLHLAEKNYTKTKFFQDLKEIVIEQEPGTQFLYSNLGTNMVAHILERVYKKTYQKLLQEFIFNKAGMHNTKLNLSSMEEKLLAGGFNEKGVRMPALPLGKTLWGAEGALKATLPDRLFTA